MPEPIEQLQAQRGVFLSEALPYFQKYRGCTIVVKYGGNAMVNDELIRSVMNDVVLLSLVGIRPVLVLIYAHHGHYLQLEERSGNSRPVADRALSMASESGGDRVVYVRAALL